MKLFISVFILILVSFNFLQSKAQEILDGDTIYTLAEAQPEFPGGVEKLLNYMAKNIKYQGDYSGSVSTNVVVSFVVDRTGCAKYAKIITSFSKSIDEQVLYLVENMPRWKPGTIENRAVSVRFNLPIFIRIE